MTLEQLAAAVAELQDRQAIHDVMMKYGRAVDRLDRELLLSVYHEDGIDDHGVFIGNREEFADWVIPSHTEAQWTTQHALFNHTCDLDGDVAHTETYYTFSALNKRGQPFVTGGGRYIDRLEKRDGTWAIVVRKCVRDWFPATELVEGDRQIDLTAGRSFAKSHEIQFLESFVQTARDHSDPSYDRPLTIDSARIEEWRRVTAEVNARIAATRAS